jgi:hypothetical protein
MDILNIFKSYTWHRDNILFTSTLDILVLSCIYSTPEYMFLVYYLTVGLYAVEEGAVNCLLMCVCFAADI